MGSNVVRADFGSGLIRPRAQTNSEWFMRTPRDAYMDSKVVRADFGSGMICPRAQTNSEWFMRTPRDAYMGSKVVRADFGSGLIRPRAQTCCASPTRTPARLANSPGFKSFRCPGWRIKFSLERFSDPSSFCVRAQGVGKFSRASSAGGRRHLQ